MEPESGVGRSELCISDVYPSFRYPDLRDLTALFTAIYSGAENGNNAIYQVPTSVTDFTETDTTENEETRASEGGAKPKRECKSGSQKSDSAFRSMSLMSGSTDNDELPGELQDTNTTEQKHGLPSRVLDFQGAIGKSAHWDSVGSDSFGCSVTIKWSNEEGIKWIVRPGRRCRNVVTEALNSGHLDPMMEGKSTLPNSQCMTERSRSPVAPLERIHENVVITFYYPH